MQACVLCRPPGRSAGCLHAPFMSFYIFVGARDVRGIPLRVGVWSEVGAGDGMK